MTIYKIRVETVHEARRTKKMFDDLLQEKENRKLKRPEIDNLNYHIFETIRLICLLTKKKKNSFFEGISNELMTYFFVLSKAKQLDRTGRTIIKLISLDLHEIIKKLSK